MVLRSRNANDLCREVEGEHVRRDGAVGHGDAGAACGKRA